MQSHTYYEVLGLKRNATPDEIINAKKTLTKVYHPDANIDNGVDTTEKMQEILEAYQILSDPAKKKDYDQQLSGEPERVFRTFTVGPEDEMDTPSSFVIYWNAAFSLNEAVLQSQGIFKEQTKKKNLFQRIRSLFFQSKKDKELEQQLRKLSKKALSCVTTLKTADIPSRYWRMDAMNWVLVRWGNKQTMDYHSLFARYDCYAKENNSPTEKRKLHSQEKRYQDTLKKLLTYALES